LTEPTEPISRWAHIIDKPTPDTMSEWTDNLGRPLDHAQTWNDGSYIFYVKAESGYLTNPKLPFKHK
jgi:hypothetical protein